jgi:glucose-1-phosphate thymidylyltransferase
MDIVGLVPAGGTASRLGKMPCSKEVFPVLSSSGEFTVTSAQLLHSYKIAGIRQVFFIIRNGKWDIPAYYGDGADFGLSIGYLIMNLPFGAPFTLNQAFPFIHDKIVALGYPDIVFKPEDAFLHLTKLLLSGNADIVLGIVPKENHSGSDMIDFDEHGKIREIVIKQNSSALKYGWFTALWRPSFTLHMKVFLENLIQSVPEGKIAMPDGSVREVYVGDVIQSALKKGLQVDYHIFKNGEYTDLGTVEALRKHQLSSE